MFSRAIIAVIFITTAALLAGCGGSKADPAADATKAAGTEPSTRLELAAKNNVFSPRLLVAKAGAEVTVSFKNEDGGTLHNFALYTSSSAKENLYRGEIFAGKKTIDMTFKAPPAGAYFFRCDVHPDMSGSFIAK